MAGDIGPEERKLERAASMIAESGFVAVSTGAGVSRESGIPTFREAGEGFWARYDPEQLATVGGFLENPKLVWDWYAWRRKQIAEVQPNPGHHALARLENLLPGMVLITQNVDGLHYRAGSKNILELHGNINRVKCFSGCKVYSDWADKDDNGSGPPRCPDCGDLLRPDVVWFGEQLPEKEITRAFQAAQECDLMLVVGTSGLVQPAASLPGVAKNAGARVVEVNPQPSAVTFLADVFLPGKSGEVLPGLVERVAGMIGRSPGSGAASHD